MQCNLSLWLDIELVTLVLGGQFESVLPEWRKVVCDVMTRMSNGISDVTHVCPAALYLLGVKLSSGSCDPQRLFLLHKRF